MLYIDLRDKKQTYTAYQALNNNDLDVVPLRIPVFSSSELKTLCSGSFSQITTKLLNLFFNAGLTAQAVELCLKKNPLIPDNLDRKTLLIKLHRDSDHGIFRLVNDIYSALSGKCREALGWPQLAIRISLLFGLYSDLNRCGIRDFDVAVCSNELLDLNSVVYARKMGLPINKIICGCLNEEDIWKLLRTGELQMYYFGIDSFLYVYSPAESGRYTQACVGKEIYYLPEEQLEKLNSDVFTAVVSLDRVKELIGNVSKTFDKTIDPGAAISYGALQDYRSVSGENQTTLVFTEEYLKS